MEKKNKAVKAVNTALGLILLVMVVLCSPLFGYARGFASKEQRTTPSAPVSAPRYESAAPSAATPRPTAPPPPTPVVLPTAPPTPVPTPIPQRTPQPQPVVQQPVYNNNTWQQDAYYEPETYVEPQQEPEQQPEDQSAGVSWPQSDTGGQITDTGNGGVIQNEDADLVINLPGVGGGQSSAISVVMPEAGESGGGDADTGDGGEAAWQPSQDGNEAEPLAFG